ncbi:MAG: DUF1858 domain-containing protein [Lachnospiraceae bacterium]|nr:DUF1858 domain-containing protein [Lachnospiraceae bacterium]
MEVLTIIVTEKVIYYRASNDKEDIEMLKEVTKDMLIGQILQEDATIAPILMASGMHCIGCPASQGESLEEASMVHGMDCNDLVGKINEYLATKNA